MSQNLPVKIPPAMTGEILSPDHQQNPYAEGLRLITEFDSKARRRISPDLSFEEFERKRLAILAAFVANGFIDIISGECEEINQTQDASCKKLSFMP